MIDGLKLTFTGEELRRLLDKRIRQHDQMADRWTREQERTKDDETEDAPLLPSHMCEHEAERHAWRSRVLAFIREHIEAGETYRLESSALTFGELLPAMPESLAQEEYEERTAVGFHLSRISKTLDRLAAATSDFLYRQDVAHGGAAADATAEAQQTLA